FPCWNHTGSSRSEPAFQCSSTMSQYCLAHARWNYQLTALAFFSASRIRPRNVSAVYQRISEGKVHCHSLPNYQLGSAVDMIKTLIDRSASILVRGSANAMKISRRAQKYSGMKRPAALNVLGIVR